MSHQEELRGMAAQLLAAQQSVAQTVTNPASGSTVNMTSNRQNGYLRIKGPGPIAVLAIRHPLNADSFDGQIRSIYFDVDIALITWPGSSALNLPSSAAAGDSCTTQRLGAGEWARRY